MSIGMSEEHADLAESLRGWAAGLAGADVARAAEHEPDEAFSATWKAVVEMGVAAIGLPESLGGSDGTTLDVAVALEACAHHLVPGPLLGTAAAALLAPEAVGATVAAGGSIGLATRPGGPVWDAAGASSVVLPDPDGTWWLVPSAVLDLRPVVGLDLTRRAAPGVDLPLADLPDAVALPGLDAARVHRVVVTLAAAEAAGVARWCLDTAVAYAKVREQFGRPIGAFQAVKHLCAQMLETAEAVTAAAWDVAVASAAGEEQWAFAADVAAITCMEGAVENARTAIQVLGGIGFTFEHDAHLYYRRAQALRSLVGSPDDAAVRLADRAADGVRRQLVVDLEGRDAEVRPAVREQVAAIAALPEPERRAALADAGLLAPHWPAPYGRDADAVAQLVIDEELAAAGVERPDLVIAGWALPTIIEHGTDAQRERFVAPSLRGELVWCQLFSEPGSGSDLASLRTRAERVEGGWALTGQKVWTSLADRADWGICLARTDPDAPAHQGITYFLVDLRSPGIEVRPLREMTGEALFNEVFLDAVFVPDELVVARPGDGWRLARTTLANERVAMGSARLATSTERAVEIAAADDLGAVARAAVGRSVALSTVCSLIGLRSTLRSLAGHRPGAESSVAKLLGVRNRQDGAELVVALAGDRLALLGADAPDVWEMLNTRCLSIAGGTTQILRNIAGERLLGLPRG
ncbi:acyl-CoA dehydrogenase [Nocardioides sp. TRM66260-LWL]|uniref:acyl-CoA dehydrogenase n=1 Tax=Nocardioides sp. TRM66260-LWL TaxID=2874478 RepID=UPI001CC5C5B5|nr:acyl-CoA dehydrogenase [Nocardioides sp. TRM66260-LWL]MBZ5733431.1 acyl-CoA dehydrogenase [Nocardioides sp. TRM66260-LWL]